ncbi:hypothetical protein AMJ80_09100 [bacterium SM23_31]|nr:MAG: hypothetical protein AMJ80_09100 [bacterium SM23_31]
MFEVELTKNEQNNLDNFLFIMFMNNIQKLRNQNGGKIASYKNSIESISASLKHKLSEHIKQKVESIAGSLTKE